LFNNSTDTISCNVQRKSSASELSVEEKVEKASAWVRLKFLTKVFPGNVQGIGPILFFIACYIAAVGVFIWICMHNLDNVIHHHRHPTQTTSIEHQDTFPSFDIVACAVPKLLKFWDAPLDAKYSTSSIHKGVFEHLVDNNFIKVSPEMEAYLRQGVSASKVNHSTHVSIDQHTSGALIVPGPNNLEAAVSESPLPSLALRGAAVAPTDTLSNTEYLPTILSSIQLHGLTFSCATWETSKVPVLFHREELASLIININITGLETSAGGDKTDADIAVFPRVRGKAMPAVLQRSAIFSHPSLATLQGNAKVLHHLNGTVDTVVELGIEKSYASIPSMQGLTQLQIHPFSGGFNYHVTVSREKSDFPVSLAIASIVSTMTLVFGVFRYLFPKTPIVPVYFRWSEARRFIELQATQSARLRKREGQENNKCGSGRVQFPQYGEEMMRESDQALVTSYMASDARQYGYGSPNSLRLDLNLNSNSPSTLHSHTRSSLPVLDSSALANKTSSGDIENSSADINWATERGTTALDMLMMHQKHEMRELRAQILALELQKLRQVKNQLQADISSNWHEYSKP